MEGEEASKQEHKSNGPSEVEILRDEIESLKFRQSAVEKRVETCFSLINKLAASLTKSDERFRNELIALKGKIKEKLKTKADDDG